MWEGGRVSVNELKAEIRRLRVENQNLRKRTHATISVQHARIRELEAIVDRDVWLPLYTMDSVKELAK